MRLERSFLGGNVCFGDFHYTRGVSGLIFIIKLTEHEITKGGEMKMKINLKLFIATLLVLTMMLGVIGCGSNNPAEPAKTGESAAPSSQAPGEKEEELVLKIGVIAPMSGTAGDGVYIKAATEMAAKEINDAGGIDGKMKIQLFVEDDEGTPAKSVTVAQKLVNQDKVDIVIGAQNSSCTLANMLVTQEAEIPQITPASSSPSITQQGNKWIFRTSISDLTAAETIMKYAQQQGWKKIALIHDSGDFGVTAAEAITSRIDNYGMEIVVKEQFNSDDVDFTTILTKVKSSGADAIIDWGYFGTASHINKQMKQNGINIPFIGYGFNNPQFTELGAEWVDGAIVASGFTELNAVNNELIQPFADGFRKFFDGKSPTQAAAQTYDTVYLIKKAIESIGAENVTNETLRDAIAKTSYRGVTGEMSFDETGEIIKDCVLVRYDASGVQHLLEW
jgi:branched-chain amino acid transport system substrate-binding protein